MASTKEKKRVREDERVVSIWVKRADRLEKDYRKTYHVLPCDGEDIKAAALAVLPPEGAPADLVILVDITLFRVETSQITPTLDEERAALSAPRIPPELSLDPSINGAHFLVKGHGGECTFLLSI
jgi:hypothetical protein